MKLTLFLEQNEYLSIFGREAGIRVSINYADTVALPVDDGITIRPGTITSIGLRYVSYPPEEEELTNKGVKKHMIIGIILLNKKIC